MQLFYAPDLTTPLYTLGEEESKHCIRVLRLRRGDTLHLTDGRGTLYRCEITEEDARRCTVRVVERFPDYERMPYRLTMAVAPTKNIERFEWFLEKATEVGVSEIVPLLCERSERRALKIERAERVVVSAMKQSLKVFCPALRPLTPLADLLAEPFDGRRLIAHCDAPRMEKRHLFDTLLCKVAAYYHDVGKLTSPAHFIENQRDYNIHDELPPEESGRSVRSL